MPMTALLAGLVLKCIAGFLLGGTHQHATFRQPERQFSGVRASRGDVVVATVGANFLTGVQRKEAFIPTLDLGMIKHRTNDRAGFFSVKCRGRVSLPYD